MNRLWHKAEKDAKGGAGILVFASQTEQGFTVRCFGDTTRSLTDWEGLLLVHVPKAARAEVARVDRPSKPKSVPPIIQAEEPDLDDPFRDQ